MQYILTYDRGAEKPGRIMAAVRKFPIRWLHSDVALCAAAAEIKAAHKVSFADAFLAATALRLRAVLLHKDPEFEALSAVLKQEMLPPKTGARVEL